MTLVFDTETTGKADMKSPVTASHQPHLVQLGAILFDDDWKVRGELNLIVAPEWNPIPKEASDIHGITNEIALKCGVPLGSVMSAFGEMADIADAFVCHNFDFDYLVMAASHFRITQCVGALMFMRDRSFCTMKATTQICKLPGAYGDYKWPKLQEAYKHFFGKEFDGAHDAMADVRACAEVYRKVIEV